MASTQQARSDVITQVRQATDGILTNIDKLHALLNQWNAGQSTWIIDASGSDPNATGYEPGDFVGSNEGLMKADIAAVFTTLAAIDTVMAAGHLTNLEKVRP